MSRIERSARGMRPAAAKDGGKKRSAVDQRIVRTRNRLGNAVIDLILEKSFDGFTVQDVLDRAKVGRSTFYVHFRDKDDLFLNELEKALEMWTTRLTKCNEKSMRIAPVEEFFAHVSDAKKLYRAMVDSGRIQDFLDLAQEYFARGIAQRLKKLGLPRKSSEVEFAARSQACAAILLSLLRWWMDRGAKESPKAVDELFHRMVWKGMQ